MKLGRVGRQAASKKAQELTENAITRAGQLQQQGLGLQKIADTLNYEGFRTSRGSIWTKQALYERLKFA